MTVYICLLFFVVGLTPLYYVGNVFQKKLILWVMATTLILVAGLRYRVGTDYLVYMINYAGYKNASIESLRYAGIYLIAKISSILYDDYATWFFLMSLFTIGGAVYAVYKYSSNAPLSILLYLFLGCWHNSFNVVKQCAAVTILILGQRFLYEKKIIGWSIICILAASFHISALLMIPVYFLVVRDVNWKQILVMISVAFIVSISYDKLIGIMAELKNMDTIDASVSVTTRNVNILRVLVSFAPVLLMCFFHQGRIKTDVHFTVLANMSMLNAFLYLANRRSVYLTRFCLYTDVFNIFFIPYMISRSKRRANRKIITTVCCVLYMIFWLYDLSKGSSTATFHWIFGR